MSDPRNTIEIPIRSNGASDVVEAFGRIGDAARKVSRPIGAMANAAGKDISRVGKAVGAVNASINTLANVGSFGLLGITTAASAVGGAFNMTKGAIEGVRGAIDEMRNAATEAATEIRNLQSIATILNVGEKDGVTAEARTEALIKAIESVAFNSSADDIRQMVVDVTAVFESARKHDEDAIKKLRAMNLSKSVAFDEKGNLRETTDFLFRLMDAIGKLDKTKRRISLIELLGSDGYGKFAPVFEKIPSDIRALMDEYVKLGGLTPDVITQAEKVGASQMRVAAAAEGLRRQLLSGLGPAIEKTDDAWSDFLATQQSGAKQVGVLTGDFMTSVYTDIIAFAEQASRDLGGVGGDLKDGPIATGLDYLATAIDYVLDRLGEVVRYIGTGQSTEWIDTVISALKTARDGLLSFKGEAVEAWGVLSESVFPAVSELAAETYTLLKNDVIPAIKSVIDAVQGIYEAFGVDSPGMQLGLTLALVTFSGTITSVIAQMVRLVGLAAKASGAISGAATATGAVAAKLAPAVAAVAAPTVAVAAGVAGGYVGLREDRILDSQADLYTRLEALAKERGGDVAAAFGIAMEAELAAQAGESWFDWAQGMLNPIYDGKGERVARMEVELEGLSRDEIIEKVADGVQAAQTAISDDTVIELGSGLQITGIEINAEIQSRLAAIPATIDVAAVTGLDRALADAARGIEVPAAVADGGGASRGPVSTVNVTLPGGNSYAMTAPADQAGQLAREIARMQRTR